MSFYSVNMNDWHIVCRFYARAAKVLNLSDITCTFQWLSIHPTSLQPLQDKLWKIRNSLSVVGFKNCKWLSPKANKRWHQNHLNTQNVWKRRFCHSTHEKIQTKHIHLQWITRTRCLSQTKTFTLYDTCFYSRYTRILRLWCIALKCLKLCQLRITYMYTIAKQKMEIQKKIMSTISLGCTTKTEKLC
jgi:hypothetical protein